MNARIKKKMFTFKIHLYRMKGASSLGDKKQEIIILSGYLKEEMKVISNELGKEVTSSAQVYIDGADMSKVDAKDSVTVGISQPTGVKDEFVFVPILKDRQILKRENFYRPNNVPEVGVIYLA